MRERRDRNKSNSGKQRRRRRKKTKKTRRKKLKGDAAKVAAKEAVLPGQRSTLRAFYASLPKSDAHCLANHLPSCPLLFDEGFPYCNLAALSPNSCLFYLLSIRLLSSTILVFTYVPMDTNACVFWAGILLGQKPLWIRPGSGAVYRHIVATTNSAICQSILCGSGPWNLNQNVTL